MSRFILLSPKINFSINLNPNFYPLYSNFAKSIFIMSLKLIRFFHFWYKKAKKVTKKKPILNSNGIPYLHTLTKRR